MVTKQGIVEQLTGATMGLKGVFLAEIERNPKLQYSCQVLRK